MLICLAGFYPYSRTHYTGRDGSFIFAGLVPLQQVALPPDPQRRPLTALQASTLVLSEAACDLLRPHAAAALEWGSMPSNLDLFVSLPVLQSAFCSFLLLSLFLLLLVLLVICLFFNCFFFFFFPLLFFSYLFLTIEGRSDQQLLSCGLRVNGSTTWLDLDSQLACQSAGGSWIQVG